MPPIYHLLCFGSPKVCAPGIFPGTISADPFDSWMGPQPGGKGFCGAISQEIHDAMTLPINEERPIFLTATKREIINAKNLWDGNLRRRHRFGET